jgi:hypothetical protein
MPLGGGQPIPLTKGTTPTWSPDGQRLAFFSDRNGKETLWVGDADGRRANEQQGAVLSTNKLMTWLPDGRLAWQTTDFRNYQIRDLTTGRDDFLLKTPIGFVFVPRFNPTGDTAAVYWNRNPRGLWLLSWPTGAARFLAADLIPDGWSRDGTWIYAHRAGTRSIVRVASATSVLEPVGNFPVGSLEMNSCHVARDDRMMVCSLEETTSDAWVIHHFDDRVRVVR